MKKNKPRKKKFNKDKFSSLKLSELARRENEIREYGKIVSLRPSVVHKSSKVQYSRKSKHKNTDYED